jgi:hypothetical protein
LANVLHRSLGSELFQPGGILGPKREARVEVQVKVKVKAEVEKEKEKGHEGKGGLLHTFSLWEKMGAFKNVI